MLSFWYSLEPWMRAIIAPLFVGFALIGLANVLYCAVTGLIDVVTHTHKSYFSKKARHQIWRDLTNSPYSNKSEFSWFVRTILVSLSMPKAGRVFYQAHGRHSMSFWTSILAGFGIYKIIGYSVGCKERVVWRRVGLVVRSGYPDDEVESLIHALGYDKMLELLQIEDKEKWHLGSVCVLGGKEFDTNGVSREGQSLTGIQLTKIRGDVFLK